MIESAAAKEESSVLIHMHVKTKIRAIEVVDETLQIWFGNSREMEDDPTSYKNKYL